MFKGSIIEKYNDNVNLLAEICNKGSSKVKISYLCIYFFLYEHRIFLGMILSNKDTRFGARGVIRNHVGRDFFQLGTYILLFPIGL